jgi:aryl carrier-like protein
LANSGRADEAPLSRTEETLAAIWRDVITLGDVGRHDNFFDVGGHSVLLIQVITRVRKAFGVELTLRHLFEAPTIGELARVIDGRGNRSSAPTGRTAPDQPTVSTPVASK